MTENKENQEPVTGETTGQEQPGAAEEVAAEQAAGEEQAAPAEKQTETAESELETLKTELAQTKDRMLRVAADTENYKKRIEREKEAIVKYAGENILRELLNTLDNLDRAIEQGVADSTNNTDDKLKAMLEGVELTRKGLISTLEKFEVSPLASVGQAFNPNEHEALTMEPSEEVPANHVTREFLKGYTFKDRLLRPAKVVVSSGPAGGSAE